MPALAAPNSETHTSYKLRVKYKIDRSIREGWLTADLQPTGKGQ